MQSSGDGLNLLSGRSIDQHDILAYDQARPCRKQKRFDRLWRQRQQPTSSSFTLSNMHAYLMSWSPICRSVTAMLTDITSSLPDRDRNTVVCLASEALDSHADRFESAASADSKSVCCIQSILNDHSGLASDSR